MGKLFQIKKTLFIIVSMLLVSILLFGCKTSTTKAGSKTASSTSASTIVVVDAAGRQVTVPKNIKKIVTYNAVPPVNSWIMAFGKGKYIINGIPSSMSKMAQIKYQSILDPGILSKIDLGSTPNVETFLSLNPDVVICTETTTVDTLKSTNIPVIYLKSPTSASDLKKNMEILGNLFGETSQAKAYNNYYDKVTNKVKKLTSSVSQKDWPKVLVMWASSMAGFSSGWWVNPAGGSDVLDTSGMTGGYGGVTVRYQLNIEKVIQWNPDVIVVRDKSDISLLEQNTQLNGINAVKNNKIYVEPAGTFTWNASIEAPLISEWLTYKLYPSKLNQSTLISDVQAFYKEFLNYSPTANECMQMLNGLQ